MSSPTRWAGVPLTDRRTERRTLLIGAAYRLFGDEGESAVSVRSVCRECGLNTRYFYESFADVDDLLGAVYDRVSAELVEVVGAAIEQADDSVRSRTRAGIAAVLGFSSADPRRGRVLFTEARANPVLGGTPRCGAGPVAGKRVDRGRPADAGVRPGGGRGRCG